MNAYEDVLIIGSGFGGAVMAARVGAFVQQRHGAGKSVRVLDKGDDHTGLFDPESDGPPLNPQGNRFRHSLDPRYTDRLAQIFTDPQEVFRTGAPSLNVLAGTGIGGGSNVYAGVKLRAPSVAFDKTVGARRLWPARYSRAALDPLYARVEAEQRVHRLAWTDAEVPHWQLVAKRDLVFAEGCRRIGATAVPLKLASDQDANEGWWTQGQRFEGRQSLTKNYLRRALDAGVRFSSGCEVTRIEPTASGYVAIGVDHRGGRDAPFEIECRVLVVAAGAVPSTALLLRSAGAFAGDRDLHRSETLGRHLSGNGDYGVTGKVDFGEPVEAQKGKPICSVCPSFFREHGFIVLPFYADPMYLALGRISTVLRAEDPTAAGRASTRVARGEDGEEERPWGPLAKARLSDFADNHLSMGCLSFDESEGEIDVVDGQTVVRWRSTDPATEARWKTATDVMRRIYEALGGEMYLDDYRRHGTVNTSHPLGGARMSELPGDGVVDEHGEVWGNRNLFVVDGAIVPTSLCANPSLTIAAVAESIAERLVTGGGTEGLEARLG